MRSEVWPARDSASPSSPWLKNPPSESKVSRARTCSIGDSAFATALAAREVSSSGTLLCLGAATGANATSASWSSSRAAGITASTEYSSPCRSFAVTTAVPVAVL